jgi:tetratricopeptide (TPR) repeat protein
MSSKKSVFSGIVLTLVLAVAVAGLYLYRQKKIAVESMNQLAAAKTLYEASHFPEAEQRFMEIAKKYPKSAAAPESIYYAARLMHDSSRYQEALEQWQKFPADEGSPQAIEKTYYISHCQENLGNNQEASAGYTKVAAARDSAFAGLALCGLGRFTEASGNLEEARARYEEALALAKSKEAQDLAEKQLGSMNLRLFLTPTEGPDKKVYLVKRGDSLVNIALANHTTIDLICKINDLKDPASLRPGMTLLIPAAEFSIVINKPDFKLTLLNRGKFFKSYKVGLGKHGCTPLGDFVIDGKEKNPKWWSPNGLVPSGDPRNELGTRWMHLKPLTSGVGNSYGIHATINPGTIGWESSNGCPRMYPQEAEELYMLIPEGISVKIESGKQASQVGLLPVSQEVVTDTLPADTKGEADKSS